jgi:phosphoenolpyruvate carboxykinase (ATP)
MTSPVEKTLSSHPPFDLSTLGIASPGAVLANLSTTALVEAAIRRSEGVLTNLGALSAFTGDRTGRSPKDKFTVKEGARSAEIDWSANQSMDPAVFARLHDRVKAHLSGRELFVFDGFACADERHRLQLRVITEKAWHSLFARCLFLRPDLEQLRSFKPKWTVLHACDFRADPARDGTRSEVCVAISFEQKLVIVCGTHYAGEIKKAMFTVLNELLPRKSVFPMHCSANVGQKGDVALFFGLSGTGKTTLSADRERRLIGDDEHGWSGDGVFNLEGGCYAKTIKLSPEGEPQIWNAIRFGCVLENVPVDPLTREPDFESREVTENTRAAYPVDFIPNSDVSGIGGHPANIFFLTCDAFGVLPPLARLTPDQAVEYFLCGYTAKVAGTEAGVKEPTPEFSACFAKPFLPLPPKRYAAMLKDKLERHHVPVWLVNTGWTGGPHGVGTRMSLEHTRALLKAVLTGQLARVSFTPDPVFGLAVPANCPGVPDRVLRPRDAWSAQGEYDRSATELAERFKAEFKKYV